MLCDVSVNHRKRPGLRRGLVVTGAAVLVGGVIGNGASVAASGGGWSVTPVVTGLHTPRGVAFDGRGAMYVAESGLAGSGPFGYTHTGAVDKYTLDESSAHRTWSTSFTSLYSSHGHGTDVEGPEGITAVGSGCMRQSAGQRNGCQVLMIMGESQQGIVASGGPAVPQIGHLFRLDGASGTATDRGDIGDQSYAWTGQHQYLFPDDFPDANPYGVLVTAGGGGANHTFVVDAAANTLSEINRDGTSRVIAYIPNETPVAGLPTRDATPTCVAQGPDGALYVGTLDLIRNFIVPTQGQSHVYRVDPRTNESYLTAAHLWASGLTAVTACTFDSSGNFWAAEMFKFNKGGPPGDIVRIPFADPAHPEHIGGGRLPFPGGIAQGPDGAMYVTVFAAGTATANGAVMRVARD